MAQGGLRVGVIGATGALGSELLALLSESRLAIAEVLPVATDDSLGQDVEFRDEVLPIETEQPRLRGLDLLFLCAPEDVSLAYVREALRSEVACIDVSGSLASSPELPLRVAAFGIPAERETSPLWVAPPGAALPLALALRPLQEAAGLSRVTGTTLDGASWRGRRGIESLYRESIAIFNQAEPPAPDVFGQPVAFDCLPATGELGEGGQSERELALASALERLLSPELPVAFTSLQVPTFAGFGAALVVETERGLEPEQAAAVLGKAPGVSLWDGEPGGLTLRSAAGRDEVLVGRLRRDPTRPTGLLLWLVSDILRLAAANAVQLAAARWALPH